MECVTRVLISDVCCYHSGSITVFIFSCVLALSFLWSPFLFISYKNLLSLFTTLLLQQLPQQPQRPPQQPQQQLPQQPQQLLPGPP